MFRGASFEGILLDSALAPSRPAPLRVVTFGGGGHLRECVSPRRGVVWPDLGTALAMGDSPSSASLSDLAACSGVTRLGTGTTRGTCLVRPRDDVGKVYERRDLRLRRGCVEWGSQGAGTKVRDLLLCIISL